MTVEPALRYREWKRANPEKVEVYRKRHAAREKAMRRVAINHWGEVEPFYLEECERRGVTP